MSWENIQVDDFGWVGRLTLKQDGTAVDISSYTTKQFFFVNPSGTASSAKTADFDSDGTDGKLKYTILTGEIDTAGNWNVFARIAKASTELTTDPLEFRVKARLD
jgi:hypothetical protein